MLHSSLEDWYANTVSIEWKGFDVVYRIHENSKPWLVLVHGFPTASYDWHAIWNSLSKQFSLVAPDMLGFGYSDKPNPYKYSIEGQADLVEDLLKSLNINSAHILAHDYGDTVAQELIARFLDDGRLDILSVVLLNGGLFPETHKPLLIQKLLMSPFGFLLSNLLSQAKFEKSFKRIFGPDTRLDTGELTTYWKLIQKDKGHRIAHLLIRYMRERIKNRDRWVSSLKMFDRPKALINGSMDPISGKHMVDRYREIISTENIYELERIGHYPQIEAPEKVVEYIFDFLRPTGQNPSA